MPDKIRPSEVSEVLLQQLKGINTSIQFDEVGAVLQVSDGVARIYGLLHAEANELLEFENGVMGVVMNLEEDNVGAVLLGATDLIKEGMIVKRTGRIASIRVSENMLGRVIDPLGVPLDGRGTVGGELFEMPLERKAPGVIYRQPVSEPLQTGIKAIDAMIPIGRGQRELIIGDRQTGKTAIAIDTIINQRSAYEAGKPVYCIYVAIGQKGSTVANIVNTLREKGAMDYTVVVAATAADPAALQYFAPFAGAAIGEYFRDTGKRWIATYGQSEGTARMAYLPAEYAISKCGSIGRAVPNAELSLIDSDGNVIEGSHTEGEMCYRGKNVTMGYARSREDLLLGDERNGFMRTGDLAYRDEDGCYYIVGRMGRFLKLFGMRIGLDECEQIIKGKYPIECACVGTDDKMTVYLTDEKYAVAVKEVLVEKTKLVASAFEVKVIADIPKNEAGKILYSKLNS